MMYKRTSFCNTFASPLLNFSVVQLLHAQRILTTKEESVSVGK